VTEDGNANAGREPTARRHGSTVEKREWQGRVICDLSFCVVKSE
jgi:hypothetical protein